jgi:hypothetical protein
MTIESLVLAAALLFALSGFVYVAYDLMQE